MKLPGRIDPLIALAIIVITAIITITLKIYVDIGVWEIQYTGAIEPQAHDFISQTQQVPALIASIIKKRRIAHINNTFEKSLIYNYENVSHSKEVQRWATNINEAYLLPCEPARFRNMISSTDISNLLVQSPRRICNCSWSQREPGSNQDDKIIMMAESTCSAEATLLGNFQKVITFSFFKPKRDNNYQQVILNFYEDIIQNFELMKEIYPGWVMRLYSDIPLEGGMCDIVCSSQNIYYCDTGRLPLLGDIRHANPRSWRFLVLGDATVAKFAVRDLDSRLSRRERDAVEAWEHSDFALHGMRDHEMQSAPIMAGMWGGDNYKLCHTIGQKIQEEILNHSWVKTFTYDDQELLGNVIYSKYKNRILTHDSYLCGIFQDSVPFPTQRLNDHDFIGAYAYINYKTLQNHCPVQCRPTYGLNWDYC